MQTRAHPVVVLTADPALADQLHRLAAAAGVDLLVREEPSGRGTAGMAAVAGGGGVAGSGGGPDDDAADLLLVGGDLARAAAAAGRPRGRSVLLVTADPDDADVWQHALALGAEQVVVLPDGQDWLVDRIARTAEPSASARVVAVVGGCGGAGASVLAAALATTSAAAGRRVLLADLDPLGGGLDLLLGADDLPGLRWPDLAQARGRLPAGSVHEALPRLGDLALLAWGRGDPVDVPPAAVEAVLGAAARSHDLVVLDLPRHGDAVTARVVRGLDELLVVVPARLRAAAAAAQVVTAVGSCAQSVRAVVRRAPGDSLGARAVADVMSVPLAAEMRDEPRLDVLLERGDVPGLRARGPLRRAADQCLQQWALEQAA